MVKAHRGSLWTPGNISVAVFPKINIYEVTGMGPIMCLALHINVFRVIDDFRIVPGEIYVRILPFVKKICCACLFCVNAPLLFAGFLFSLHRNYQTHRYSQFSVTRTITESTRKLLATFDLYCYVHSFVDRSILLSLATRMEIKNERTRQLVRSNRFFIHESISEK